MSRGAEENAEKKNGNYISPLLRVSREMIVLMHDRPRRAA